MEQHGLVEGPTYTFKNGQWEASISLKGQQQRTFYGETKQKAEEHMLTYLDEQTEAITKASTLLQTILGDLFEMPMEQETKPERYVFVTPNRDDLEQLIQIEQTAYHEETIIPIETILKRRAYNPENIHVLKDSETNTVLGSITMSPLHQDVLEKLINLEIDETQIRLEDYRSFTSNSPLDCYVVSIIVRPSTTEKYDASKLLLATMNFLVELLNRGVTIRRIYTVATTENGERLAQSFGFTCLKTEWIGEHEAFRRSYVLDLEATTSKSKLIKRYLSSKKNFE